VIPSTGLLGAERGTKPAQTGAKWAVADVPTAGDVVERGWPILTILVQDMSSDGCLATLQQAAQALLKAL
jgi:predicted ATP-grasp superfamily ATP-dependent carboligase